MKKFLATITAIGLLVLAVWSPWDSLSFEKIAGVDVPKDFSSLYVSSLGGDLEVYLDGEKKGEVSLGEDPFVINGIPVGDHKLKLRRVSQKEDFYPVMEKEIFFESGLGVVVALELGPSLDSTSGYIISAKYNEKNPDKDPVVNINTSVAEVSIFLDEVELGQVPIGPQSIPISRNHEIKINSEKTLPLEFTLFPVDDKDRAHLRGTIVDVDAYLYRLPIKHVRNDIAGKA